MKDECYREIIEAGNRSKCGLFGVCPWQNICRSSRLLDVMGLFISNEQIS